MSSRTVKLIPIEYRGTFVAYGVTGEGFLMLRKRIEETIGHGDFCLYYEGTEEKPFLNGNHLSWKDTKLILKREPKEEEYADEVVMAMLKAK